MRLGSKHVLVALVAALLVLFTYSPLLRAGLTAGDYAVLLDPPGKPVAAASLRLSALWSGFERGASAESVGSLLRGEQLVLLLVAAVGLGFFVRRLLLPWTGSEAATGSALASTLLFAVHPLAVWAVADLEARGDLLGLALAIPAAHQFLRGRQDQRFPWTALAFGLAAAAGFTTHLALGLPPLLFACELASAHRYRPFRSRLRTATTTLLLFGAAVALDPLRHALGGTDAGLAPLFAGLAQLAGPDGATRAASAAAGKLGLFVLPANAAVSGVRGIATAGTVFLLALTPAFAAARSAPRLWGWLASGWLLSLCVSLLLGLHVPLAPGSLGEARTALPSLAVMAAGLGLCATALSGPRRPYVAWLVALGYAALGHANARPWPAAARAAEELRGDLYAARDVHGALPMLVLDPPEPRRGVDGIGADLPALADPRLGGPRGGPLERTAPVHPRTATRSLSSRAFLAGLGEPEFEEWLGADLLVLYPREALGTEGAQGGLMRRPFTRFRTQEPSRGPWSWKRSLRSPTLELGPRDVDGLRVTLAPGPERTALGPVSWRSRGVHVPDRGRHAGAWSTDGDVGVYDLASSLAWRLGGRVRSILFEEGSRAIETAQVLEELPGLGRLAPRRAEAGWSFGSPALPAGFSAPELRLSVLELGSFGLRTFPVRTSPTGEAMLDEGAGAALDAHLAQLEEDGAPPVAWILEALVEGLAVARERGRL